MEAPRLNSWSSSGQRVATGTIQFEGDVPGIFVRGAEAAAFASSLTLLLRDEADRIIAHHVFELGNLLINVLHSSSVQERIQRQLHEAEEQFLNSLAERGRL